MTWKDLANRLFWTVVSAAGGVILAAPTLNLDAAQAAGTAALIAAVNFVTLEARRRVGNNGGA